MASTPLTSLSTLPSGAVTVRDASLGANNTPANLFPAGGACTFYEATIDNTANAAQAEYYCIYDATSITVGTTAPDIIVPIPAGSIITVSCVEGYPLTTGFSHACKTAGGTAGSSAPTNAVVVTVDLAA